ncbi:hypothetical protein WIS52_05070 [Pseudonocardia nematodicida]|uniref:3-methyl-2-oxobutanoate hydroxymethyltransferase n=1 Tax=Pseudonocardia nematodicida TaxID=1206997 RepID=A0ABV1K8A5_9PSEU
MTYPAPTGRPILQSSCALATTATEAGYRIDARVESRPGARVVALDDDAATLVRRIARDEWAAARFYALDAGRGERPLLRRTSGAPAELADEIATADVVVMVATARAGRDAADAAAGIGQACAERGVMTAGVVLGEDRDTAPTVHALRPYARVLLVGAAPTDLTDLLTAIRA